MKIIRSDCTHARSNSLDLLIRKRREKKHLDLIIEKGEKGPSYLDLTSEALVELGLLISIPLTKNYDQGFDKC